MRVTTEWGTFEYPEGDRLGTSMHEGHYEKAYIKLVLETVKKFGVAVDVGANIGFHTIPYAQNFGGVHSFEPHPTTFPFLKTNVKINNLSNVVVNEVALGDAVRTAHMAIGPGDLSGARIHTRGTEVVMRTLDSYELPVVDLIKIDVEGYEGHVVSGASGTIRRCRPLIMFEQVHPRLFDIFGFLLIELHYSKIECYGKNYLAHP